MLKIIFAILAFLSGGIFMSMRFDRDQAEYIALYQKRISTLSAYQKELVEMIRKQELFSPGTNETIKIQINNLRKKIKATDIWLRYLDPISYKKINGPLPVEWETEVFEKYEKPYKRYGAGVSLAEAYLEEPLMSKDSLLYLVNESESAITAFQSDSIKQVMKTPDHFFFANRLFLLNLAAIYTTGFECPDQDLIVEELQSMLEDSRQIYSSFNKSFPSHRIDEHFLSLFDRTISFIKVQSRDVNKFDHFHFIRDFVNPLFSANQQLIRSFHVVSRNYNDYSLSNQANSIFNKALYTGQNRKGIFIAVEDEAQLNEISNIGKLLFYDPILSGNGKRSCASCHKPEQYFADTSVITNLEYNETTRLTRNTPSLVNVAFNHLLMQDGKHTTLQNQAKDVITNPKEMGCDPSNIVGNVMSCGQYKTAFQKFRKLTPNYPEVTIDHITSAVIVFYSGFSDLTAPFDRAMNRKESPGPEMIAGFNLFMSKAKCATCHFVPQFNGVKPPYIGSEFEVLGVPADKSFSKLSNDSGRFQVNPAKETLRAFRTGTIRNSLKTKPYMHNGVFETIDEVIDFYDTGGGAAKGLKIDNQTLPRDSLHLTKDEKRALRSFIHSLTEEVEIPKPPIQLPATKIGAYKFRKPGGEY